MAPGRERVTRGRVGEKGWRDEGEDSQRGTRVEWSTKRTRPVDDLILDYSTGKMLFLEEEKEEIQSWHQYQNHQTKKKAEECKSHSKTHQK